MLNIKSNSKKLTEPLFKFIEEAYMQPKNVMDSMKAIDMIDNITKIIENYAHAGLDKQSTRVNLANDIHKNIIKNNTEPDRNERVLRKLAERLDIGQLKYGKSIPRSDGRNWIKESLEEILDAMVYVGNVLLTIDEESGEGNE